MEFYVFTYKVTIEYNKKIKIKSFEPITTPQITGYSNKEITPNLIEKNLKKKLDELSKEFKSIIEKKYVTFTHPFKGKDNKIYYFKEVLYLTSQQENYYTFYGFAINISHEKEKELMCNNVQNSPHIGCMIYKDKIIQANKYFKEALDIGDEILNLSPLDIFPEPLQKEIKPIIEKRLKGEFFDSFFSLEISSFKNRRKYVEFFSNTIIYEKEYAGFVIGLDKTSFFKQKKLLEISSEVNKVLSLEIFDINELIDKIINAFKKNNFYSAIEYNKKLNNYPSSYTINLKQNNKIFGKIYLYSKYEKDFDKDSKKILQDIEKEINRKIDSINLSLTQILLKIAVDKGFEWILVTDENGKIIYINDSVEKISKYSKDEILNKKPNIFKSNIQEKEFYKKLWQTILNNEIFEDTIINRSKNGDLFYLKEKIIPITLPNGKRFFVALGIDITQQKLLENKIIDISFKDQLTNLLNREGFIIYSCENVIRNNSNFALILIDIKDFHFINELKGHKKADQILKQFANFLHTIFENAPISRIGDDEFAVLIEFKNKNEIEKYLNKLLNYLKRVKFDDLHIDINAGIAIFPKDANNIENLLQKASIALERAKNKGENVYEFFDSYIIEEIKNYLSVKELLNDAIKNKKFIYYFQPYVDAKTNEIVGAESLIRIKDNENIIPPNVFIDYAEKSGLIKKIEKIMIKDLIKLAQKIDKKISFNISGVSLEDNSHVKFLIKNLSRTNNMVVEITERALISDLDNIKKIFEQLKEKGIEVSIDDFGTGYSSLNYIKHIQIDNIKIDMSFIKNITNSLKDKAIVDTIINFAKRLNLKTIAEGVENEEQVKILKELGCDYLQGYYFYKPVPEEEFLKLITK